MGKQINIRTMMVIITKDKLIEMVIEIKHWHSKMKSFTIIQGVIVCETLEHWVDTLPWAKFLSIMIRKSVNICLNDCLQIIHSSEKILKIIRDLNKVQAGEEYDKLDKFIKKIITRETYQCKHQAFINAPMKQELKYLEKVLTNPDIFKLETLISHLVNREFDITSKGDACLEG